jgi:hypothetical protein
MSHSYVQLSFMGTAPEGRAIMRRALWGYLVIDGLAYEVIDTYPGKLLPTVTHLLMRPIGPERERDGLPPRDLTTTRTLLD